MNYKEIKQSFDNLMGSAIIMSADDLRTVIGEQVKSIVATITTKEDENELIGTAEACKILGVCPRTMQRYRDLHLFKVSMRGPHKALYRKEEILAFRNNY